MEPGDLVKIKIKFTPKDWSNRKPMIGVLLRRWSKELKIPEFDFFGESDEDIAIEISEPLILLTKELQFMREISTHKTPTKSTLVMV